MMTPICAQRTEIKKQYSAPKLIEHGTVEQITGNIFFGMSVSGGTTPPPPPPHKHRWP